MDTATMTGERAASASALRSTQVREPQDATIPATPNARHVLDVRLVTFYWVTGEYVIVPCLPGTYIPHVKAIIDGFCAAPALRTEPSKEDAK